MKLVTFNEKIIVQRLPEGEDSGSIAIPDSVKKVNPFEGTVVSIGAGVPEQISSGTHIIFNQAKAVMLEVGGNEYFVIELSDVFAAITEDV